MTRYYHFSVLTFVVLYSMTICFISEGTAETQTVVTSSIEELLAQLNGNDTFMCDVAAEQLARIGEPVVDSLLVVLRDGHRDGKAGAMKALAKIQDERAIPPILNLLQQLKVVANSNDTFANEYLRHEAIRALGDLHATAAIDSLKLALETQRTNDRIRALISLVKIGDETALSQLTLYLNDKEAEYRNLAVQGLGEIGGESAVKALAGMVEDAEWYVRDSTAEALGKIGSRRALNLLERLVDDRNPFVQRTAKHYLNSKQPSGEAQ